MARSRFCSSALIFALAMSVSISAKPPTAPQPVIVGYVFPQSGPFQAEQIDAHSMTRINYAFAVIKNERVSLTESDGENLAQVVALRKQNPSLTVLISVGGWLGSGGFSDAALSAESRSSFGESALALVKKYDLDGIDVDWEYPGMPGAGNRFRKEDKHNFTLLLKELRERLDEQSQAMHRPLYLTIAAGASSDYTDHTEMSQVAQFVDTVNLMTYDYYEAGADEITGNHAPLFTDPADPKKESADSSVQAFEAAGVAAGKIVLGVPFYGRMWGQVPNVNHGLFQQGKPVPNSYSPYNTIQETMLNHGYERFWDASAMAPSLYNKDVRIFVSYEDQESLAVKCDYIKTHHLGGIMFWSYFNDPTGQLLTTINRKLREPASSVQTGE